jgi:acetyl-CoA carboxylase biotin carboxyl carrier protein
MNLDEIKALLDLFNASGVGELEVERKDTRVRISRMPAVREYAVASPPPPTVVTVAGAPEAHAAPVPVVASPATPPAQPKEQETNDVLVKSPIVGTFYESASPGAAAFVKVGDSVDAGQVLCIIESMKLMNEIEAEVAGTITARLVENGKPVEYGEPLFSIRPRG